MIKVDKHLLKKTDYDVKLVNGTKIEFNNSGEWTSVDCKKKSVPDELVPKHIRRKVAASYPDATINRINKKSGGHIVGLSDGT
ncbi:PepSY-like domain-containing protein [Muribaculum intestinale]|uniref:PepSY-like domain-containing protein n=2 Tax=Muribaculum TaxID=1918540 RepID=UPI00243053FC|nr:PepSY-like domain-containing protein [Muribaculum intestinale]